MKKVNIKNMPELPYATEESLNRLRINLNFLGGNIKKILVISSTENEGKSFVSFHIWRQMAQSGIHSVLLDADLRKSVMAETYQMEPENGQPFYGTSHVLAGKLPPDEAVWKTELEKGDILPNVENVINPAMLFEGETFKKLLEKMEAAYRYTFIDAPPLELVSDGEKIASLCDGAILVVASGRVSRKTVRNSVRQLERAGCPLLGIVLNRAEDMKRKKYYKQYGYGTGENGK